ncbi:hypothetical protein BWI93_07950 [Siphonobacter sp. BAB-5385]|nr:hypothetical protein BWI93_07950 [Siphonobacter sp. BAB-5385]
MLKAYEIKERIFVSGYPSIIEGSRIASIWIVALPEENGDAKRSGTFGWISMQINTTYINLRFNNYGKKHDSTEVP